MTVSLQRAGCSSDADFLADVLFRDAYPSPPAARWAAIGIPTAFAGHLLASSVWWRPKISFTVRHRWMPGAPLATGMVRTQTWAGLRGARALFRCRAPSTRRGTSSPGCRSWWRLLVFELFHLVGFNPTPGLPVGRCQATELLKWPRNR
jgi:hypothetical protein